MGFQRVAGDIKGILKAVRESSGDFRGLLEISVHFKRGFRDISSSYKWFERVQGGVSGMFRESQVDFGGFRESQEDLG